MLWEHRNKCLKGGPRVRSKTFLLNQVSVNSTEFFWETRKTFRLFPCCSPKPPMLSSVALAQRF